MILFCVEVLSWLVQNIIVDFVLNAFSLCPVIFMLALWIGFVAAAWASFPKNFAEA